MRLKRIQNGLAAVLPRGVQVDARPARRKDDVRVHAAGRDLVVRWIPQGSLNMVRDAIQTSPRPDIIMSPYLSAGARHEASAAGIGWLDETGAAEIVAGNLIVTRDSVVPKQSSSRWTPATEGVAEAILAGVTPTVNGLTEATGVAPATAARALSALTHIGLLSASAARGRNSGRRVKDHGQLLHAYAEVVAARPVGPELRVGVIWRDPLRELPKVGTRWNDDHIAWAATSAISAAVMAPLITQIAPMVVYLDATTLPQLAAAAAAADLKPSSGGRLVLRPFPSTATRRLSYTTGDLRTVTWPRAYADLRTTGVRGEEGAEHLREAMLK